MSERCTDISNEGADNEGVKDNTADEDCLLNHDMFEINKL